MNDIERWGANAIDKTDAEKVAHYDSMRKQNRLHMVWHGELQEALESCRQQHAGAVEALEAILAASDTSKPVEVPINRLAAVHEEARLALDRLKASPGRP